MSSYIVRNGRLELRQKDLDVPNYRVIPYKSINNPSYNDYITNTFDQLKQQAQKAKNDYRNLIQTVWRVFSQLDRTLYDPNVMFLGLRSEQIYDKISLIRSLNGFEQQQQSLRLSAIMKVDDNLYAGESPRLISEQSPQLSRIREEIKQQSLYEIQEEEECCSNASRISRIQPQTITEIHLHISPHQRLPDPQNPSHHRLSLNELSGQKRQGRRSSFFLKEKISLALNEQQQLRQLLEEELQKITIKLDSQNEFLHWTIQQLAVRNQLIQKLKHTILLRDQTMEAQQKLLNMKHHHQQAQLNTYHQVLEERDHEIGELINSLIERTEETHDDFEYLTKSVQAQQAQDTESSFKVDENHNSIDIQEFENSVKENPPYTQARSPSFGQGQVSRFSQSQPTQNVVLRPKNIAFNSADNITYLTKEHFLQAQKKNTQSYMLQNVMITESLKVTPLKNGTPLNTPLKNSPNQ